MTPELDASINPFLGLDRGHRARAAETARRLALPAVRYTLADDANDASGAQHAAADATRWCIRRSRKGTGRFRRARPATDPRHPRTAR